MQELYDLGAKRIAVFGAPPIGCLPSQRTLAGGLNRMCVDRYNQAAQLYNAKLSSQLDTLGNTLPQSKVVYVDIYNPLLDLIQNPQNYGKMSFIFSPKHASVTTIVTLLTITMTLTICLQVLKW